MASFTTGSVTTVTLASTDTIVVTGAASVQVSVPRASPSVLSDIHTESVNTVARLGPYGASATLTITGYSSGSYDYDKSGDITPSGPILLSAAQIASPTAAILADTTATYIGPAPDYFRYYSNSVSLNQFGNGGTPVTTAFATISTDVTRPADTTAYAANDAISNSTSSPTSGGFTLTSVVNATGKSGIITDIFIASSNPAGGLSGELWIFDTAVTNINDNAAFAISDGEIKTVVAIIPFTTTADTNNSQIHLQSVNVGVTTVGSADLRFLLKAKAAYTPISAEVFTIRAKLSQMN